MPNTKISAMPTTDFADAVQFPVVDGGGQNKKVLGSSIRGAITAAVTTERTRAQSVEGTLIDGLAAEVSRAQAAEAALASSIAASAPGGAGIQFSTGGSLTGLAVGTGLSSAGGSLSVSGVGLPIDFYSYAAGTLSADQLVLSLDAARPFGVGANLSGWKFTSDAAATASTTFTVQKNGATVGTIVFGAASTSGTLSGAAFSIAANDRLDVKAPSSPDATLAGVRGRVTGTRT